jgi:hypothetical protein
MRSIILFFIALIHGGHAVAAFDLSSSISGKSYPSLGGALTLDLGYNLALWGEVSKTNPWYGMIRLSGSAETSSVVYQHDSNITIYPISFIALGAGRTEMTSNYSDFNYFDCDEVRCEGTLKKDYVFGKMILAYDNFIISFKYTFSKNTYDDPDNKKQAVAEYTDIVTVSHTNETSTRRFYFAGYKMDQDILGIMSDRKIYHSSGQESQTNALIYQLGGEAIDTMFGMGSMHSSHQSPGATVLFLMTYKFLANRSIF